MNVFVNTINLNQELNTTQLECLINTHSIQIKFRAFLISAVTGPRGGPVGWGLDMAQFSDVPMGSFTIEWVAICR